LRRRNPLPHPPLQPVPPETKGWGGPDDATDIHPLLRVEPLDRPEHPLERQNRREAGLNTARHRTQRGETTDSTQRDAGTNRSLPGLTKRSNSRPRSSRRCGPTPLALPRLPKLVESTRTSSTTVEQHRPGVTLLLSDRQRPCCSSRPAARTPNADSTRSTRNAVFDGRALDRVRNHSSAPGASECGRWNPLVSTLATPQTSVTMRLAPEPTVSRSTRRRPLRSTPSRPTPAAPFGTGTRSTAPDRSTAAVPFADHGGGDRPEATYLTTAVAGYAVRCSPVAETMTAADRVTAHRSLRHAAPSRLPLLLMQTGRHGPLGASRTGPTERVTPASRLDRASRPETVERWGQKRTPSRRQISRFAAVRT